MALDDPNFKRAGMRAIGLAAGIGKVKKPGVDQEFALVELIALNVKNRDLRRPMFLQHPPHLPEGGELKALLAGTAAKDAQLRADAREWAQVNRREAARGATSLRNAIEATRIADHLMDEEPDEERDSALHEWRAEILVYVAKEFGCDPREASHDRAELDAWCLAVCQRANPAPAWLESSRGTPPVVEKPATVAEHFARHMTGEASGSEED